MALCCETQRARRTLRSEHRSHGRRQRRCAPCDDEIGGQRGFFLKAEEEEEEEERSPRRVRAIWRKIHRLEEARPAVASGRPPDPAVGWSGFNGSARLSSYGVHRPAAPRMGQRPVLASVEQRQSSVVQRCPPSVPWVVLEWSRGKFPGPSQQLHSHAAVPSGFNPSGATDDGARGKASQRTPSTGRLCGRDWPSGSRAARAARLQWLLTPVVLLADDAGRWSPGSRPSRRPGTPPTLFASLLRLSLPPTPCSSRSTVLSMLLSPQVVTLVIT